MRIEVRLAGAGGQGLILAGIILAEACGVYEGKYVVQTQNYGPEARGGSSRSDVIISDQKIFFPQARKVDILACLSQEAYYEYADSLQEDGIILLDSFYVRDYSDKGVIVLPFSQTSRQRFGRELFANMILLGTVSKIIFHTYGFCSLESLKKVIEKRVSAQYRSENRQALDVGYEMEFILPDRETGHSGGR